jgi:hypothetical protein
VGTLSDASRSARWTRPGRKSRVLTAAVVVFGSGFGLSLAAGGASGSGASLRCAPSSVQIVQSTKHLHGRSDQSDGGCVLIFSDGGRHSGYGASPNRGRSVCFTTAAPNQVVGLDNGCTSSNHDGHATARFRAVQAGTATVTATESINGSVVASATVTIPVTVKVHSNKNYRSHH